VQQPSEFSIRWTAESLLPVQLNKRSCHVESTTTRNMQNG
jgi:hypothetical protein